MAQAASIGRLTVTGTTGAAALEIIAGTRGCRVKEIGIELSAATASIYQLGRPAAKGVTPTTPVPFLYYKPETWIVSSTTAVAWATPPTVPAQFYRTSQIAGVVGQRLLWENLDILIPVGGTMVLWNGGTNSVAQVTIVIEE